MSDRSLLIADPKQLMGQPMITAIHALIADGLPKRQAAIKLGIGDSMYRQITKVAERYIGYYAEGEDVYTEKLGRNSETGKTYIENCVAFHITCEQAEVEFADVVVQSVMRGVEESPDIALKVLERRFPKEWGQKKETNVNIDTKSVIKTIQINVPTSDDAMDAEYTEA